MMGQHSRSEALFYYFRLEDQVPVEPGLMSKVLLWTGFPAFVVGAAIVRLLARWGISEVATFLTSVPLLICVWYYLLGWLVDAGEIGESLSVPDDCCKAGVLSV